MTKAETEPGSTNAERETLVAALCSTLHRISSQPQSVSSCDHKPAVRSPTAISECCNVQTSRLPCSGSLHHALRCHIENATASSGRRWRRGRSSAPQTLFELAFVTRLPVETRHLSSACLLLLYLAEELGSRRNALRELPISGFPIKNPTTPHIDCMPLQETPHVGGTVLHHTSTCAPTAGTPQWSRTKLNFGGSAAIWTTWEM